MKLNRRLRIGMMSGMILCSAGFMSCDSESVGDVMNIVSDVTEGVSDGDTVDGLKSALQIGVKAAVQKLSNDGYIAEAATKIGVPEGAVTALAAIKTISETEGGKALLTAAGCNMKSGMEETMVTLFNDAATEAVPDAAGIFADAITNFTIEDGKQVLFGGQGAATAKLKNDTYTGLQGAFHPTITRCMESVSFGGYNAKTIWSEFAGLNNKLASYTKSELGQTAIKFAATSGTISKSQESAFASIDMVDTDISNYLTGKALDGLFKKVEEKENDIRTNAASRTSDLLRRVFGQLD